MKKRAISLNKKIVGKAGSLLLGINFFNTSLLLADIVATKVDFDLSKPPKPEAFSKLMLENVALVGQPMVVPKPEKTETPTLTVRAMHDGKWIAFSLQWKDTESSKAGPLGEYSDAVAIQFPVKDNANPPPIFMGVKDNPVHIFHWRAQYQEDKEKGLLDIKQIYPNMQIDIYPMEFPDMGTLDKVSLPQREIYSYGRAAGNPQSYVKKGVDEIMAEGFGTSSVIDNVAAEASGIWSRGEWTVVITRPLQREGGSNLKSGQSSFAGFAVWQGGKKEVGSRKSVTMMWVPLQIK